MERPLPLKRWFISICLVFTVLSTAIAQTTYTWNNAAGGDYATAANWTPARTTPAANDVLVFSDGGTYNVAINVVTTQTIGSLSISNGTKVTFQPTVPGNVLTIAGVTGDDLSVAAGCELNIAGSASANNLVLALATGATGSISGNMTFTVGAQKVTSPDVSGITFNSGSLFTAGTGLSGNPYGTATSGSVVFASGSTYIYIAGSNPFGGSTNVVVFQTGSLYKHQSTGSPSLSGKIYADFEYDKSGTCNNTSGSSPVTVDNFKVTQGTFSITAAAIGANIKGNVTITDGAALNIATTSASAVTFAGSAVQTINTNSTGTITLGPNVSCILSQNLLLNGTLNINGTLVLGERVISGTGTLAITSTGKISTTSALGLSTTNNLLVATRAFDAGATYIYNGTSAQVTGDALPATARTLAVSNAAGVTLTNDLTVSTAVSLTSGNLYLGTKNLVMSSGANIASASDRYVIVNGTGTVSHVLAPSTTPVFGFGTATSFAPVICTLDAASPINTVVGTVKSTITNATLHNDRLVQNEWQFTETLTGPYIGTATFCWNNNLAKGTAFDVTKPVVFAVWDGAKYNTDDVTPVDLSSTLGTGMYGITVSLPASIPATPIIIGNKSAFLPDAPALTADATANSVENNIEITFTDDAAWRSALIAVSVNGTPLTPTTDYTVAAGIITLIPSGGNTLLTTSGTKTVTVTATGYNDATVSQVILAGAPNVTNSTVTYTPAPGIATTTTVTVTARDGYNNPIPGYVFRADATVTDAIATTDESYTINGSAITATATDMALTATDASGVATFDIVIPATVDGGDGISVQVQLNDGTTNLGTAISYSAPLVPTVTIGTAEALTESNLGTVVINVTISNETFADNTLAAGSVTLNNAPAGVAVTAFNYISSTTATITVSYNGTDFDSNITNFNITIAGSEFTLGNPLTSNNLTITATVETIPVVTTNTTATVTGMYTAIWGGEVTATGGEEVTVKGICFSTSVEPSTANVVTTEGAGIGTITGSMISLLPNTVYYVRAYATNSVGTAYGDEHTFTTLAPFEDFTNFPETTSSYNSGTFIGRDGSTWTYVSCSANTSYQITTPSPVLAKGKTPAASVTSGTLPNGISTLGFKYVQAASSSVNLDVYVNSILVANVTTVNESGMANVHTVTGIPVYVGGDVVIKFVQNNVNSGQVTIDDIQWTPYVTTTSTVAVPRFSPLPCTALGSQSVTMTCETAGAEIHYTLDGTDPTSASTLYTAPVNLTSTATVKAIAIFAGMADSPIMSGTYTVEQITDIANITALRLGTIGSQVYRLTGEAILTYSSGTNQKYIQDANAGILIYDNAGIITTTYNQYDGITGITGRLADYNGVMEFIPVTNPAAATSTGNTVTPVAVTPAELNANPDTYESRLIKITGATFADAGGTFAKSTNYNISDGTTTTVFRAAFATSDIIGATIPTKADIIGLGMEYLGTAQIASRYLADLTIYSSAKAITAFAFNGLTPAVNGTVNETAKTITATVPAGTNRATLVPTITVSANATVSPVSGVAGDFTSPVTYTVTAQDGTTQAYVVTVTLGTGIDDETVARVKLYPVPATTEITAENIETITLIEVFNVAGVKLQSIPCTDESYKTIPLDGYAHGLYFLRFTTADGTFMKKFIKQ